MLHRTKEHLSNFSFFKLLRKDASSQPRIPKPTSDEQHSESVLSSDTWVDAFEDQPFEFPSYFGNPPRFHQPGEVDAAEIQQGYERYPNNPLPPKEPVEEFLANMGFDERLDSDSDYAPVSSAKHHSSPNSINSGEWVFNMRSTSISPPSRYGNPQALQVLKLDPNDLTEEQAASHFPHVLKIFCRIYAIAKLMQVAFLGYGIELDSSETGLLYWIHRAEINIQTDSLFELAPIVENLFYSLYARVQFEMSCVELCWLFRFAARLAVTDNHRFYMPVPQHMYRIFHFFREILSDPGICAVHDNGIICHFMEQYVQLVIEKENNKGPFIADDILGYRQWAYSVTRNQGSEYCRKWDNIIPMFPDFPAEILVVLSEKYLTINPKCVPEVDIRSECLPFASLELMDPAKREKEIILDNHLATVAKLEGKCIGDCRREDKKCNLLHKVKQFKCICRSRCSCARRCTHDVERPCPCAERQLRMQLAINRNGAGRFDFVTRVSTIAMAGFQGLAALRTKVHDEFLIAEIAGILGVINDEIHKQRAIGMNSWLDVNDQESF